MSETTERQTDAERVDRFERAVGVILGMLPIHLRQAYPRQAREIAGHVFRLAGAEPPTEDMRMAVIMNAYKPVAKKRRATRPTPPTPEEP